MEQAPAWAAGWGIRGRVRGAPVRLPRAVPDVATCTGVVPCVTLRLELFVGRKKSRQVPDSNPRPPDPQPSSLTTRTRGLDASDVCIFIPWSARGASSSRGLEERGGSRRRRERLRIRLSPNGGSRDWRGSHWGVLLAVCGLLHLGLVALPVAPRGAVRSAASARRVVASMLPAGAAPRMPDPPPSSCGFLQRGWGFLLRSAAGWGSSRRLGLSPTRMEPSPRSVPLSAPSAEPRAQGSARPAAPLRSATRALRSRLGAGGARRVAP